MPEAGQRGRRRPASSSRARSSTADDQGQRDRKQEQRRLEEREVGALEVDRRRRRAAKRPGREGGQERADAGRGAEADALEDVEKELHVEPVR